MALECARKEDKNKKKKVNVERNNGAFVLSRKNAVRWGLSRDSASVASSK